MLERSIPGFFGTGRKAASGKLPAFEVIADAFAANTFARAGLIAAIAGFKVFVFMTFHGGSFHNPGSKFNPAKGRIDSPEHGLDPYHEITR